MEAAAEDRESDYLNKLIQQIIEVETVESSANQQLDMDDTFEMYLDLNQQASDFEDMDIAEIWLMMIKGRNITAFEGSD